MTVSLVICFELVTVMVVSEAPQLKVMIPPAVKAVSKAASLHVPLPEPTTVVGLLTSAATAGSVQAAGTVGIGIVPSVPPVPVAPLPVAVGVPLQPRDSRPKVTHALTLFIL
jgi:hypothetical protein